MSNIVSRFTSRKFILALVSGLVVFLNGAYDLGLNLEEIISIVGVALSYILVEGAADIKER